MIQQLQDIAQELVYTHGKVMIHGELKGVRVFGFKQ